MELKDTIRLLLVDDDETDFAITKELLSDIKSQQYSLHWVSTYKDALSEIQKDCYDLFIIDYNLGAHTGLDLIDEMIEKNKDIPIIMLTGQGNHEIDLLAMKKGASDFLIKGKIEADLLERSIRYAIEKKASEKQILYLAYYDQLTDLPNRIFFKEQLNYALAHAIRYKRILAVLFLDLDNFKFINDSLGHHIGDLLLKEVAKRLYASTRKSDIISRNSLKAPIDTVARLGGDEFTISLTEINTYEDASIVANRIIKNISEPFYIENHQIYTSASIGISLYPSDSDNADTLLKYADNAMYYAKKNGKINFQYYTNIMNTNVTEKMNLINSLRNAVDQNEFLLFYQPKLHLQSGKITGFEALIRWNPGGEKIILPLNFIPFAEKNNLISFITEWVVQNVCKQFIVWQEKNLTVPPVSINLPLNQFKKLDFVEYFSKIIESYHIAPELIELEVLESIFIDDINKTISMLKELREKGFRISVDDFGTGFSSFNLMKEIPFDKLNIDKSFINNINKRNSDNMIIKSIIFLGHALNIEILAEGVETMEQLNFIKNNGCDLMQGFLLSPPLTVEETEEFLKNEKDENSIGKRLINDVENEE